MTTTMQAAAVRSLIGATVAEHLAKPGAASRDQLEALLNLYDFQAGVTPLALPPVAEQVAVAEGAIVQWLKDRKGHAFATIRTRTMPKVNKGGRKGVPANPHWNQAENRSTVVREVTRQIQVGLSYENAVNNQAEREGVEEDFSAKALWMGKGHHLSPIIVVHEDHPEDHYLAYKPRTDEAGNIIGNTDDRWYDEATGETINPADLAQWLPPEPDYANQPQDRKVPWRTLKLSNLLWIRLDGVEVASAEPATV